MITTGNYDSATNGGESRDRVTRGEQLLNRLVNLKDISDEGRDWLIAAIDPMHDRPLKRLEGFPDEEVAPSVVSQIKQTIQFDALNATTSTVHDIYVVLWPLATSVPFQRMTRVNNLLLSKVADTPILGALQIFFVPSGSPFNLSYPSTYVQIDPEYLKGATRVLSLGVEIHDVTNALHQQGTLTAWRQPETNLALPDSYTAISGALFDGSDPYTFSNKRLRHPPSSTAEAMLLSGSVQWPAKKGVYMVSPMCGERNPITPVNYLTPTVECVADVDDVFGDNTADLYIASPVSAPAPNTQRYYSRTCKLLPFHTLGFMLTGLAAESTFTLQLNAVVETFPSPSEKQLVVLAKPSAVFDPRALSLYSQILTEMPVAVPADWNGLGEWFAEAVSTVAKYAQPVASALNPMLGMAVNAAGEYANNYIKKEANERQLEREMKVQKAAAKQTAKSAARAAAKSEVKKELKKEKKK